MSLRVELIATGEEVLHGHIDNTNGSWAAAVLAEKHFPVSRHTVVGDAVEAIRDVLLERSRVADVLVVCGGLGPTADDVTALAAAQVAGDVLKQDEACVEHLRKALEARPKPISISQHNLRQAEIPSTAASIPNRCGSACGFKMKFPPKCYAYFLPGVPHEFKDMLRHSVLPELDQQFPARLLHACESFTLFGVAESEAAAKIDAALKNAAKESAEAPFSSVGYRVEGPVLEIKVTGNREPEVLARSRELQALFPDSLMFAGRRSAQTFLVQLLEEQGCNLKIWEDQTGGSIVASLTQAKNRCSPDVGVRIAGIVDTPALSDDEKISREVVRKLTASCVSPNRTGVGAVCCWMPEGGEGRFIVATTTSFSETSIVISLEAFKRFAEHILIDSIRRVLLRLQPHCDFVGRYPVKWARCSSVL